MSRQLLEQEFRRIACLATDGNAHALNTLHNAVVAIVEKAYPQRAAPRQCSLYPVGMVDVVAGLCYRQSIDDGMVNALLDMMRMVR